MGAQGVLTAVSCRSHRTRYVLAKRSHKTDINRAFSAFVRQPEGSLSDNVTGPSLGLSAAAGLPDPEEEVLMCTQGRTPKKAWLVILAGVAACSGSVAGPGESDEPGGGGKGGIGDPPDPPGSCGTVGPSPVRRLSQAEYRATLHDLFAGIDVGQPTLTADNAVNGFENRADKLFATEGNVGDFSTAAISVAAKAVAAMDKLASCSAQADEACGKSFVKDFGERAFRRPLSSDELSRYGANFEAIRKEIGFREAAQLTIEAMLQSVNFLYRLDLGDPKKNVDGRLGVTGFEMASRLSYLLWGSMPDANLFKAARDGKLTSDGDILAQAKRMLNDERMRGQMVDFHRQWLDFDHINLVYQREGEKDSVKYPGYTAQLRAAMREESDRFTEKVMVDGSHSFAEMLTSRASFVNAPLAKLYGVAAPASGWQEVELPESERAGILTRAGFLASRAHKFSGSPPLRAVFVMRRLLCMPEMVPAANANTSEPVQMPGEAPKTNRQLFEARVAESGACRGCHQLIDPIGFPFEHYDAIGGHRKQDNGIDVDAAGALQSTDVDGPVANAIELSHKLAQSEQVQSCMARQWLGFATGVEPEEEDCRVQQLTDVLKAANGDVHMMLLSLVKSPDFLSRTSL